MDAIRSWLYVGKYQETLNREQLAAQQIGAILQLAEAVVHPQITSIYLPVEDGVPLPNHLLRQGVDFTLAQKQQGTLVLIACGAGISRSVTFAIATLKEAEDLSLLAALRIVKKHHTKSLPHPALWKSLCLYYGETVSIGEFLKVLRESEKE